MNFICEGGTKRPSVPQRVSKGKETGCKQKGRYIWADKLKVFVSIIRLRDLKEKVEKHYD